MVKSKEFTSFFKVKLLGSSTSDRMRWAQNLVGQKISVSELVDLLVLEKPLAIRFSWFLSELAMVAPQELKRHLPYFFSISRDSSL